MKKEISRKKKFRIAVKKEGPFFGPIFEYFPDSTNIEHIITEDNLVVVF
jgi:hypothetical protein